jgi:hypothetical protein
MKRDSRVAQIRLNCAALKAGSIKVSLANRKSVASFESGKPPGGMLPINEIRLLAAIEILVDGLMVVVEEDEEDEEDEAEDDEGGVGVENWLSFGKSEGEDKGEEEEEEEEAKDVDVVEKREKKEEKVGEKKRGR